MVNMIIWHAVAASQGKILAHHAKNRRLSVTYNGKKTCYIYGADGGRLKKIEGLAPGAACTPVGTAKVTLYVGPLENRDPRVAETVLAQPLAKYPPDEWCGGVVACGCNRFRPRGFGYLRDHRKRSLPPPWPAGGDGYSGAVAPETKGWIGVVITY